jgi:hypothetical protein
MKKTSIEATLDANPGIRETYRAYFRLMHSAARIEEVKKELEKLSEAGVDKEALIAATQRLKMYKGRMREFHQEAIACLKNEDELRANLGMPPLPSNVINAAGKSLRKWQAVFEEQ